LINDQVLPAGNHCF